MNKFPLSALVAGVLSAILFAAGIVTLIGPVASDSSAQMAALLASGRGWALVSPLGVGLAAMLALWFVTVLRSWLRSRVPNGGEELGTAALAGTALTAGMALVGMSFFYGATYQLADQGGSDAVRGLVDAANAAMMLTKFPGALAVTAISVAISRAAFPGWLAKLGYVSAAALIGSTVGLFTTDSFTQFGGPLDFYGTLPAALWGALLMVQLYTDQAPTPAR
jgi:hypothetical protein